ncbi:MAG TPA: phosphodiester glycosidase family protein, partial [Chloroflexia bacterium]|nr:phosphodiester glycosidase family protein [Chloroflexia bacterium]
TYLRPDPRRPYALVYMVAFDPQRVRLHMVPGTKEPVSPFGRSGPGQVASEDLRDLVAAFNGGWKSVHGNYGMLVDGQQIAPPSPRLDTATLAEHADGRIEIASWKTLQHATDLISYRQNCPMMIDNGTIAVQDHITSTWGLSLLSQMYVWRSGLGMTADGSLIYAAGNPISAEELASALQQAGAVTAMQLDINSAFVHWLTYTRTPAGGLRAEPLVAGMAYRRDQYLTPTDRDFFYLTWPTVPVGAPIHDR